MPGVTRTKQFILAQTDTPKLTEVFRFSNSADPILASAATTAPSKRTLVADERILMAFGVDRAYDDLLSPHYTNVYLNITQRVCQTW